MKCKACDKPGMYWNSVCPCGYYQHSMISPKMFNYLKVEGNAEKLYSLILKDKQA